MSDEPTSPKPRPLPYRIRRRTFVRRSSGITLGTVIGLGAISRDAHAGMGGKTGASA